MIRLRSHTATVICRRDGSVKRFYYLAARQTDGSLRFGLRYGCGDKCPGSADCIRCWNALRRMLTGQVTPPTSRP